MFGDGISTSEVLTEVGTVYSIPDTLDPSEVFARVLVVRVDVDCRLLRFVGNSYLIHNNWSGDGNWVDEGLSRQKFSCRCNGV